jgi:hypothetical protein
MPQNGSDMLGEERGRHRGQRQIFIFRETRHATSLPANLRNGSEAQQATVTNLSSAGFQATTQSPVPDGSELTLDLQGAELPAVAQWAQEDRTGFRFLEELDSDSLKSLIPRRTT